MRKGKFNIVLPFYAIVAFVLAIFGQVLLGGLLLGFVMVAEQDEWATRQCMQAFFLSLVTGITGIIQTVFGGLSSVPIIGFVFSGIITFINIAITVIVVIFAIIGLVHVCKGEDAKVPWFSSLAGKAYGAVSQHMGNSGNPGNPGGPTA